MGPEPKPLHERLWSRVRVAPGDLCWHFTGKSRHPFGYGRIGTGNGWGEVINTHRAAWLVTYGPIPPGMHVLHCCDNPVCCRPDHLYLGTQADNVRDAVHRGRHASKLTYDERLEALGRYLCGETAKALATEFGVTPSAIEQYAHRYRRRHQTTTSNP